MRFSTERALSTNDLMWFETAANQNETNKRAIAGKVCRYELMGDTIVRPFVPGDDVYEFTLAERSQLMQGLPENCGGQSEANYRLDWQMTSDVSHSEP